MTLTIETEQEEDGRWIADVVDLPGVMCYGATHDEAIAEVTKLARRVLHDEAEGGGRKADSKIDFREQPHA